MRAEKAEAIAAQAFERAASLRMRERNLVRLGRQGNVEGFWEEAARPLPEPPRNKRVSASSRVPLDKMGEQLEQWMHDLTVGNTLDGE